MSRKCTGCQEFKDEGEFSKDKSVQDGLSRRCKVCRRNYHLEYNRQYRKAKPEKHKAASRRYRQTHPEKTIEDNRRYREENPEKLTEIHRRYREENREKVAERSLRYFYEHPEQQREKNRQWYKDNPEKARANNNRRRVRLLGAAGSHTETEWQALCSYYMDQCLACGDVSDLLTRDHVVPIIKGGSDDISNIQPLCFNCNSRKGTKTIDYRQ